MDLYEFFIIDQNIIYTTGIAFILLIAFLEGLGALIGLSIGGILDNLFSIDTDTDIDASSISSGGLTSLLGWLCFSRLPFLIWFILFVTSISMTGITLNYISFATVDYVLPVLISVIPAIILGSYITHFIGVRLAAAFPKTDSNAVTSDSFAGLLATITVGTAKHNYPAEAMLRDEYGQLHYVMVIPDHADEVFKTGTEVVLIEKRENAWISVKTPN